MELTDELFTHILGVTVEPPSELPPNERRATPRIAFGCRGTVLPLFDSLSGKGRSVLLRDISKSGVGFLTSDRMAAGDEFILRLSLDSCEAINIHCLVRHCDAGGSGGAQYVVGASFELVLDRTAIPEVAPVTDFVAGVDGEWNSDRAAKNWAGAPAGSDEDDAKADGKPAGLRWFLSKFKRTAPDTESEKLRARLQRDRKEEAGAVANPSIPTPAPQAPALKPLVPLPVPAAGAVRTGSLFLRPAATVEKPAAEKPAVSAPVETVAAVVTAPVVVVPEVTPVAPVIAEPVVVKAIEPVKVEAVVVETPTPAAIEPAVEVARPAEIAPEIEPVETKAEAIKNTDEIETSGVLAEVEIPSLTQGLMRLSAPVRNVANDIRAERRLACCRHPRRRASAARVR